MGMAMPHLEAIAMARGSAAAIFAVLDRVSKIDSLSQEGHKPAGLQGDIQLQGVHFKYPARPEVKVSYVCEMPCYHKESTSHAQEISCVHKNCMI
jgi:ATP-binding cassette subfamily B (MDR/TAP) protein 1